MSLGQAVCGLCKICPHLSDSRGFLISIFFIFVFYKNIFSIWKFTEIYPGRWPGGRDLAARQPGGRGFSAKKIGKIIADRSLGPVARLPPGRPAAGRPVLPPLYKGWLVPPPLICITTIPETKKKERGREREAKPCRIFEPATAGNQNSSSRIYK